eukprot:jgi/Botrbrau1/16377/Bobra.85_2s0002.1
MSTHKHMWHFDASERSRNRIYALAVHIPSTVITTTPIMIQGRVRSHRGTFVKVKTKFLCQRASCKNHLFAFMYMHAS